MFDLFTRGASTQFFFYVLLFVIVLFAPDTCAQEIGFTGESSFIFSDFTANTQIVKENEIVRMGLEDLEKIDFSKTRTEVNQEAKSACA